MPYRICRNVQPRVDEGIVKLDQSCISNPKSEIVNWTNNPLNRMVLVVQSAISDFGFEMPDSSNFTMHPGWISAVCSRLRHILCMLFILFLFGCRQEMADQPRYDPLQESEFYSDQLSARPLPEGVVSRDFMEKQEFLDTGTVGGQPADRLPYPITMDLLRRGQDRYNIYCTPCHDYVGTGNGMAVQRGFRSKPPNFHAEELRSAPTGRFFDAITNGFGAMPSYANQLAAPDRWAVIAYVRALQLSQSASTEDVPPDILQGLQ